MSRCAISFDEPSGSRQDPPIQMWERLGTDSYKCELPNVTLYSKCMRKFAIQDRQSGDVIFFNLFEFNDLKNAFVLVYHSLISGISLLTCLNTTLTIAVRDNKITFEREYPAPTLEEGFGEIGLLPRTVEKSAVVFKKEDADKVDFDIISTLINYQLPA